MKRDEVASAVAKRFEYLLNAMENAAAQERPADHDYFGKRQAVLKYVADLESAQSLPAQPVSAGAEPHISAEKFSKSPKWHSILGAAISEGRGPRPEPAAPVSPEPPQQGKLECVETVIKPLECFLKLAQLAAKETLSDDDQFDWASMLGFAHGMFEQQFCEAQPVSAGAEPSELRERFEEWAARNGLDLCPCDDGSCGSWRHYQFDATIWAWKAWQAAQPTQEQLAEAARKIAAEEYAGDYSGLPERTVASMIERILTEIFGGGKKA